MTDRILPNHRYSTCHKEMDVRALVITEAWREGAVVQQIWNNQKHKIIGVIVNAYKVKQM